MEWSQTNKTKFRFTVNLGNYGRFFTMWLTDRQARDIGLLINKLNEEIWGDRDRLIEVWPKLPTTPFTHKKQGE